MPQEAAYPWVYADEITNIEGAYANGDLVDVVTNKGKYLGTGFINDNSKIKVRIIYHQYQRLNSIQLSGSAVCSMLSITAAR